MKFYTIAMMMFILNVSLAIINAASLFTGTAIQPQQDWLDEASAVATNDEEYFQKAALQESSDFLSLGDFLRGLWLFVKNFAKGVVAPYYILRQFGMPVQIAVPISSSVYLIYFIGIAQFIANRGMKTMK